MSARAAASELVRSHLKKQENIVKLGGSRLNIVCGVLQVTILLIH